jgi:uncharacterized protein
MPRMIFVNLPVTDVARARAFHQALGHSINEQFSDATGACVVVSDSIYIMVLSREKFAGFATLPVVDPKAMTGVMVALSLDSRTTVDAFCTAALGAGGSEPKPAADHGFMYQRTIADPDGNVFEPFWMDAGAVQG